MAFENSPAYSKGFENQLNASAAALSKVGASELDIDSYIQTNEAAFARGEIALTGGNFDFEGKEMFAYIYNNSKKCQLGRCDVGELGTLDFSHKSTFHLDTASPYSHYGWGLLVHIGVDVLFGNVGTYIISRPWP